VPEGFVIGTFSEPDALVAAAASLSRERCRVYDVFAPYPIHGLDEAMAIRRTRLPVVTLLAGFAGLTFAAAFQFYTNILDWRLDVGGKPNNSWLAFFPICFELTVLCGGLTTVLALLVRARLYPGKRELLATEGVTDDSFALVLRRPDNFFERRRVYELLEQLGARWIEEKEGPL
jgi:hypothetical protein